MRVPAPFVERDGHIGASLPGGQAVFTTRRGGVSHGPFASLNLGVMVGDDPAAVADNRARVGEHVGIPATRFAHGRQVHGCDVAVVTEPPTPSWSTAELGDVASADGQVTAERGIATVVLTADCLPIALVSRGGVAMVHAGWRGLATGVLAAGVAALREAGDGAPVAAAIGPGAGRCCYEVSDELVELFAVHGADVHEGRKLDLKLIAARQLAAAGVDEVHDVGLCTICADPSLFFSHRRDGPQTGRQAGVAWRS